jgi:hypothetical protein
MHVRVCGVKLKAALERPLRRSFVHKSTIFFYFKPIQPDDLKGSGLVWVWGKGLVRVKSDQLQHCTG